MISLLALATRGPAAATAPPADEVLLFSFFRDNGQDGLFLAWSKDGLKWEEIKPAGKSFLQPALGDKLMRDPCIQRGPDGVFQMVWTTSWRNRMIGHAHSKDLLQWSEQQAISVMEHEPTARNAWAPELFYDAAKAQWLIFWSTTIPGRFPETETAGDGGLNHRMYYTATKDFLAFTATRLFYDGGFNVIDGTLLQVGDQFHLMVKDETRNPVKKNLRLATGPSPEGPWGAASAPFTPDWVEGPSAIKMGDAYYVYFDHYAKPHYYGAVRSTDLKQWEDISPQVVFPTGTRHGTVFRVPASVLDPLQAQSPKP